MFRWGVAPQTELLKAALTNDIVLAHPDMSKPFTIFTDASNYGVGAVLMQDGRPIWFTSRSLTSLERKDDKEGIAVLFGLLLLSESLKPRQSSLVNGAATDGLAR